MPMFESNSSFDNHDLLIKMRREFEKLKIDNNKKQSNLLDFFTK